MAYGTSVSPLGYKPVRKKRPPNVSASGMLVSRRADGTIVSRDPGTSSPAATVAKSGKGAYTSTNTTSNARAGEKYRTQARAGGVVHVYEGGKRVFVKKPKRANPTRSLHADPNPAPRITEDDPRWDARTMGNKTGIGRDGNYYKNGKRVPRYSGRKGRPSR